MKKAIIYDLDNTIYPVASVGEALLAPLFDLVATHYPAPEQLAVLRHELMHRPFQVVAARHHFSEALTAQSIQLLQQLTFAEPLEPFADYAAVLSLSPTRYLVTKGFTALQRSKIAALGIAAHFAEIHIVDVTQAPTGSPRTKQDVFAYLLARHSYAPAEALVVGDDPESEIKAAQALGIDTVLYDREGRYPAHLATYTVTRFTELPQILNQAGERLRN